MCTVLAVQCPDLSTDYESVVGVGEQGDEAASGSEGEGAEAPLVVQGGDAPVISGGARWRAAGEDAGDDEDLVSLSHGESERLCERMVQMWSVKRASWTWRPI